MKERKETEVTVARIQVYLSFNAATVFEFRNVYIFVYFIIVIS